MRLVSPGKLAQARFGPLGDAFGSEPNTVFWGYDGFLAAGEEAMRR